MFHKIEAVLRGDFLLNKNPAHQFGHKFLFKLVLICGAVYGVFMGLFSLLHADSPTALQIPASALKIPLFFILTMIVTLPSLYTFATLTGAKVDIKETTRLLLGCLAMSLAVLASLGPVTGFFTLSTDSYGFMVFLNVLFIAGSCLVGFNFLNRSLHHLFVGNKEEASEDDKLLMQQEEAPEPEDETISDDKATDSKDSPKLIAPVRTKRTEERELGTIFKVWMIMFGIVAAQMSWIVRPLIGDPTTAFTLFEKTDSNFLAAFFSIYFH